MVQAVVPPAVSPRGRSRPEGVAVADVVRSVTMVLAGATAVLLGHRALRHWYGERAGRAYELPVNRVGTAVRAGAAGAAALLAAALALPLLAGGGVRAAARTGTAVPAPGPPRRRRPVRPSPRPRRRKCAPSATPQAALLTFCATAPAYGSRRGTPPRRRPASASPSSSSTPARRR